MKRAIFVRTGDDDDEAIRLFTLLESSKWTDDPFLHCQMRTHFKHGKTHNHNQLIIRLDKHNQNVVDGKLFITVHIAPKYDEVIRLVTNTTGEGVDLADKNLRIFLCERFVEIHYGFDKGMESKSESVTIGVDKGIPRRRWTVMGTSTDKNLAKNIGDFTSKVHGTGKENVAR